MAKPQMYPSLKGRVALVTGASSGIGAAAAIKLAGQGVKVAALDVDEPAMAGVIRTIRRKRQQVLPLVADVSDAQQMEQAVETIAKQWRRLDIVFANAGINGVWASLDDLTPDEWDRTLRINLRGTFLTVKYALPLLRKRGGSVVITSSVNGNRIFSNTGATAYSCSKAGQVAFTKMVALELAEDRIRVNAICPGAIRTNIDQSTEQRDLDRLRPPVHFPEGDIPLTGGKPGDPDQVADVVLYLASDASSHVSGTILFVDGAQSLIQG